ncbi:hypothetical protein LTR53_011746 [Teratosphaeriaceae sp. CCFEE 6253]|nr:hypothetical protein LTR53_011746 [Teratosphaeriaceae sp. CCFEE 6253]
MSYLRVARQSFLRPITRTSPRAAFTTHTRLAAGGDYGSGEDAPDGQKPSQQTGKNPSEHLEHPGPPPPSVVGGKQQQGSEQSGGESKDTSSQQSSGGSKGTQGAQPKLHAASTPAQHDDAPEDVKKHNQEMDQRAEKTTEKGSSEDMKKQAVGKDFWAGAGGVDKKP